MSYQSTHRQIDIEDIQVVLSHRGIVRARTLKAFEELDMIQNNIEEK